MEKNIKFEVIPHYVDEILVEDNKTHRASINKANSVLADYDTGRKYEFDNGECPIEMEFYDGIALATDGCGLYMTYPKLTEVAKSPARQESIQDYTGIYDGTINQHDVALRYGVLKFDKNRNKVSTSLKQQGYEHETLVLMSGDIFQQVYNMSEVYDYNLAASLVRDAALRFEKKWWEMKANDKNDELDYILEMEKFEEEELDRLRKVYDNPVSKYNETITKEEAVKMLMNSLDSEDFGNRFYELVQDLCNKAIQDIEAEHTIVDADGEEYTGEDGEMWYDDSREDFMKAAFEMVQTGEF